MLTFCKSCRSHRHYPRHFHFHSHIDMVHTYTHALSAPSKHTHSVFSKNASNYTRFYVIWLLFSVGNTWIIRQAHRVPLDHHTPSLVFRWFQRIYQICFGMGVFGYAMILLELVGVTELFFGVRDPAAKTWFEIGMYLFLYGLYFGVLGRDIAQLLADHMVSLVGYYNRGGLPKKHLREGICAVCGDPLEAGGRETHQLDCRHRFHEDCIRGWCLVGKKDL